MCIVCNIKIKPVQFSADFDRKQLIRSNAPQLQPIKYQKRDTPPDTPPAADQSNRRKTGLCPRGCIGNSP